MHASAGSRCCVPLLPATEMVLRIPCFILSRSHLERLFPALVWLRFVEACFVPAVGVNSGGWTMAGLAVSLGQGFGDFFLVKGCGKLHLIC